MKRNSSRFLPIYISIAVVVGMFVGNFYANHFAGRRINLINTSSNKLSDLLHIIDDQYVDTVSMSELVENSLPLILRELDPHSTYVSADDVESEMQSLKGSFSGIGVQFILLDDTVRIVQVIEGGPSERVGLKAGDRIVAVDKKPFVGKKINEDEKKKYRDVDLVCYNVFRTSSSSSFHLHARLALKTEELAVYCGRQFDDIWADFLIK